MAKGMDRQGERKKAKKPKAKKDVPKNIPARRPTDVKPSVVDVFRPQP